MNDQIPNDLRRAPEQRTRRTLAIALCLALGMLAMGAGGALAASGLSSDRSAAQVQYASPGGDIGGTSVAGGDDPSSADTGAVKDETSAGTAPQAHAVQSSGKLPFTGFASYFVLVGVGMGLLLAGVVLRRRTGLRRAA